MADAHQRRLTLETLVTRLPALMIPHGAGPSFFLPAGRPGEFWGEMGAFLRGLPDQIGQTPKAVLVISAHWEADDFTVTAASRHRLLFDYYGFPAQTYALEYPAAGAPELAGRCQQLLWEAGMVCAVTFDRGLDHGVFVPFLLIYPEAQVPIIQLSLRRGLSDLEHLRAGEALAPLREDGVLIVGSGMTYHNLGDAAPDAIAAASEAFDLWLRTTLSIADPVVRGQALGAWPKAPGAMVCHPTAEHFTPLLMVAGAAAGSVGRAIYSEALGGLARQSAFRFD